MTSREAENITQLLKSGQVILIQHFRYYTGEIVCTQYHFAQSEETFISKRVEIHGNGEDISQETKMSEQKMAGTLLAMEYEKVRGSMSEQPPY